ncbi:MAG: cytochrome c [Thiomargarita sp.]|nr:cytochrome c [Thiomargarita sp.]
MDKLLSIDLAKKIFYGSILLSSFIFLILSTHTLLTLSKLEHHKNLTPQVVLGKRVWEKYHCVGCHTLLGEGSYYAPELSNVYQRRGEVFIKHWIKSMPINLPNRRKMPQLYLTDEELEALIAFLKWTSEINTSNWPPNLQG